MSLTNIFVEISMSENDKRLLLLLLIVAILLLLVLCLIGMLIRYTMAQQAKRIDFFVADAVRYRVVGDPSHFKNYATRVNHRLFYRQAIAPWVIAFVSLLTYIIYAAITDEWGRNYWGEFGSLFYQWDWGDPDNFTTVFNITLLAKWPNTISTPSWHNEYWISYILVPLWLTAIIYYLVVVQAFLSRSLAISKRAKTIYDKKLDGYNYYDSLGTAPNGMPNPDPASVQTDKTKK